ncbi:hypothetical protein ABPG74_020718 [Tetrahymena malaccensis]
MKISRIIILIHQIILCYSQLPNNIGQQWFQINEDQSIIYQDLNQNQWVYSNLNQNGIIQSIKLKNFVGKQSQNDQYMIEKDNQNHRYLYIFTSLTGKYQKIDYDLLLTTQNNQEFDCQNDIQQFGNANTRYIKRDQSYVMYYPRQISHISKTFSPLDQLTENVQNLNQYPDFFQYMQDPITYIYWKGKKYQQNSDKRLLVIDYENNIVLTTDSILAQFNLDSDIIQFKNQIKFNKQIQMMAFTQIYSVNMVRLFGIYDDSLQFYDLNTFKQVGYSSDSEQIGQISNFNEMFSYKNLIIAKTDVPLNNNLSCIAKELMIQYGKHAMNQQTLQNELILNNLFMKGQTKILQVGSQNQILSMERIVCQDGYFFDSNLNCTRCKDDEIMQNGICSSCPQGSKKQNINDIVCIAVTSNCDQPTDQKKCECQDYYYQNSSQRCIKCQPGDQFNISKDLCEQQCNDGSYFDGQVCQKCISNCKVCKNSLSCIQCDSAEGYFLDFNYLHQFISINEHYTYLNPEKLMLKKDKNLQQPQGISQHRQILYKQGQFVCLLIVYMINEYGRGENQFGQLKLQRIDSQRQHQRQDESKGINDRIPKKAGFLKYRKQEGNKKRHPNSKGIGNQKERYPPSIKRIEKKFIQNQGLELCLAQVKYQENKQDNKIFSPNHDQFYKYPNIFQYAQSQMTYTYQKGEGINNQQYLKNFDGIDDYNDEYMIEDSIYIKYGQSLSKITINKQFSPQDMLVEKVQTFKRYPNFIQYTTQTSQTYMYWKGKKYELLSYYESLVIDYENNIVLTADKILAQFNLDSNTISFKNYIQLNNSIKQIAFTDIYTVNNVRLFGIFDNPLKYYDLNTFKQISISSDSDKVSNNSFYQINSYKNYIISIQDVYKMTYDSISNQVTIKKIKTRQQQTFSYYVGNNDFAIRIQFNYDGQFFDSNNDCIQCKDDEIQQNDKCVRCPQGQIKSNNVCIPLCDQPTLLKTCECQNYNYQNSTQKCIQCQNGEQFDITKDSCAKPSCGDKQFFDGQNCQLCKEFQEGCDNCSNNQQCNLCIQGYFLDNSIKQCQKCMDNCQQCTQKDQCIKWEVCEIGQYLDQKAQKCQLCHPNCKSCNGPQENNCRECYNSLFVNEEGKCSECDIGQYKEQNQCLNCHWTCKECNGPNDNNCLSCQTSFQFSSENKCLTEKQKENYDEQKKVCQYSWFEQAGQESQCQQSLEYAKLNNQFFDKLSLVNLILAFLVSVFAPLFSPFAWFYIQQQQLIGNFTLLKSMNIMWINQLQLKISYGYNIINNFSNFLQKSEDTFFDFSLFNEFIFKTPSLYKFFIENTLVHASILIIIIIIFGLLMILKSYSAFAEKLLGYIKWNLFINFFMVSSNFLILSAIIEFKQGKFSNIPSLVFFIIIGVFYLIFLFKSVRFLFSYNYYLRFIDKNTFVCLNSGLVDTQRWPRLFWLLFEIRKIISCISLNLLQDTIYGPWVVLGFSLIQIVYLIICKPLIDKKANTFILVIEFLFAFVVTFISLLNNICIESGFSSETDNIFKAKVITGGLLANQVFCLIALIYICAYALIKIVVQNQYNRQKSNQVNSQLMVQQNFNFESLNQIVTALEGTSQTISWQQKTKKK